VAYEVELDWDPAFHRMLGMQRPCPEHEQSGSLWADIGASLATTGLLLGCWTYGEYSDADAALGATHGAQSVTFDQPG